MNEAEVQDPSLIYTDSEPDLNVLSMGYGLALTDNDNFFQGCAISYDDRHNLWPGKSWDMRKGGANAFPWDGASDNEVNVVGERLDTFLSILMQGMTRSHVRASPVSASAAPRAATVSAFLKWMQSTYIPNFKKHMRLGANHLLEKGLMVTYIGWRREKRSRLQTMSLDELMQIPEVGEQLVEMILGGQDDEVLAQGLMEQFDTTMGRAKKAIRQLRKKGEAELPIAVQSIDEPIVDSLAPDADVIFPNWTMDPQEAPYFFIRKLMTAQQLEKKVESEGWDREWVDYAINHLRGVDADVTEAMQGRKGNAAYNSMLNTDNQLVLVVYGYQRLIDEDDGSEGIYCTVFHPRYTDKYAIHELMNGYDDYPVVVTRLTHSEKRLYETLPMSRSLRGPQMQIKTEVDGRVDRNSMAILPPMMHPAGRAPSEWGPGRKVPYRRLGEIAFGPTPVYDPGSKEMEMTMRQQADRAVGLDMESPLAVIRQQDVMDIFLDHVGRVLDAAFKLYEQQGPDEIFFQVTGDPTGMTMQKGGPDDKFSIVVSYDTGNNDPESVKAKMTAMGGVLPFDTENVISRRKYTEAYLRMIDPVMADGIMQPQDASLAEMQKDVSDDLAKIYAGIEVPARLNGAQIAIQIIQAYVQQPDIAQRLQQDEAFRERLTKYMDQYTFQMQQAQNAVTGRIGTAPAEMGGMDTQNMEQA